MFSQTVGNKLRTYELLKEVFETEMYLSNNISSRYRSGFAFYLNIKAGLGNRIITLSTLK
jgi:hypothetical protein